MSFKEFPRLLTFANGGLKMPLTKCGAVLEFAVEK